MTGRFLVELHDVSYATRIASDRMRRLVPPNLLHRAAVLVVPRWYGRAYRTRDARRWLADWDGTRVLHGLTHCNRPSVVHDAWYGTANESECRHMNRDEAESHLRTGRRIFAEITGENPAWYCAPRWQASQPLTDVLRAEGIGCLTRDELRCPQGPVVRARAIWFDEGRRALAARAGAIQRWLRVRSALGSGNAMRVVIHPRDAERSRSIRAIARLFGTLADLGWTGVALPELATS